VLERTAERFARLIVRAEADGVLIVSQAAGHGGTVLQEGRAAGYVLDRKQLIARVVVTQDNIDLVRSRFGSVELRLAEEIAAARPASVIREMPGGVEELPTAALGASGGGPIAVDPKDSNGVKTLERVFIFDLQLPAGMTPKVFGERVHVRFDHGGEPLLPQGYRRVRQLFLSRFNV